jgi:hypothetical protein
MADAPKPEPDGRLVVWLSVKDNGRPEMGTAASPEAVPDRAVMWCRVGDASWTRRG